jgi:hypothetical protein
MTISIRIPKNYLEIGELGHCFLHKGGILEMFNFEERTIDQKRGVVKRSMILYYESYIRNNVFCALDGRGRPKFLTNEQEHLICSTLNAEVAANKCLPFQINARLKVLAEAYNLAESVSWNGVRIQNFKKRNEFLDGVFQKVFINKIIKVSEALTFSEYGLTMKPYVLEGHTVPNAVWSNSYEIKQEKERREADDNNLDNFLDNMSDSVPFFETIPYVTNAVYDYGFAPDMHLEQQNGPFFVVPSTSCSTLAPMIHTNSTPQQHNGHSTNWMDNSFMINAFQTPFSAVCIPSIKIKHEL